MSLQKIKKHKALEKFIIGNSMTKFFYQRYSIFICSFKESSCWNFITLGWSIKILTLKRDRSFLV